MSESYGKEAWLKALRVQGHVINALILREMKTIHGRSRLGYLMQLVQDALVLLFFWGLRSFFGMEPPGGMSLPVYILTGMTIFNVFRTTLNKNMAAVRGNKALLFFSRVQPIDLFISRTVLINYTSYTVFTILLTCVYLFGFDVQITVLGQFIISMTLAGLLGMGAGTLLCALERYIPSLNVFISIPLRVLFFTSGVIIEPARFPPSAQEILQYNPMLHAVEISRLSFSPIYQTEYNNVGYVAIWIIVLLSLGLLFERTTRHQVD